MKKILSYVYHALTFVAGIFLVGFIFKDMKEIGFSFATAPKLIVYIAAGHLLVIMIVFSLIKGLCKKDNTSLMDSCALGIVLFPATEFLYEIIVTGSSNLITRLVLSVIALILIVLGFILKKKKQEKKVTFCAFLAGTIAYTLAVLINIDLTFAINNMFAIGLIIGIPTYASYTALQA